MDLSYVDRSDLASLLKNEYAEVKALIEEYDKAKLALNKLKQIGIDERRERRETRRLHRKFRKRRRMEVLGNDGSEFGRKELVWNNRIINREERRIRRELRWNHRQLRKEMKSTRKEMSEIKARVLVIVRGDPNDFKN